MSNSHSLYRAYDHPKDGWQVARIRFNAQEHSNLFYIRSYCDIYSNQEKFFNIFDGCPNTGSTFTDSYPISMVENSNFDREQATIGFYKKEAAVAIWKELVGRGWNSCFSTVCCEVEEQIQEWSKV